MSSSFAAHFFCSKKLFIFACFYLYLLSEISLIHDIFWLLASWAKKGKRVIRVVNRVSCHHYRMHAQNALLVDEVSWGSINLLSLWAESVFLFIFFFIKIFSLLVFCFVLLSKTDCCVLGFSLKILVWVANVDCKRIFYPVFKRLRLLLNFVGERLWEKYK